MKNNKLGRLVNKAGMTVKKHSPEILVGAGVVGMIVTTVMACKATTKVEGIIADTKEDIDVIHDAVGREDAKYSEYSEEDAKKDLTIVYARTGVKLAKNYAPSIVLGAASITCILAGHNILKKRNAALAVAYTAVDKSFKEYRSRVIERFGEGMDKELKYNLKAKEIEEIVVDEKGKEKKVKKSVNVAEDVSQYSVIFEPGNPVWADPAYNENFITAQETYLNNLLQARGFVFLNEVYDILGFDMTKAGQVVGWVYKKQEPIGDNIIEITRIPIVNEDGDEVLLLDFNVDGNIWELM